MKLWYGFAKGRADGDRSMREALGGKGANLAEMSHLGIPVPPGFTLPTHLCLRYYDDNVLAPDVIEAVDEGVAFIESQLDGRRFGDPKRPLLLSVRSGARESMPGMMDTVLNLGLTDRTVIGLAEWTGNRRFALDAYRRLIQMYGDVVRGVDREALEAPLTAKKKFRGVALDTDLDADDLAPVVQALLDTYASHTGEPFPQDPRIQLQQAVCAVFKSWHGKRAQTYRRLHSIPDAWGTAANVQGMVFGNAGGESGTGVAFSRDPSTGEREILGEWLPNAQGEDVVAGIRTPGPVSRNGPETATTPDALEDRMPELYRELVAAIERLEKHFRDLQDIEFTIEQGTLFLLQTRNGKRTATAALKCAVDMVSEGLIEPRDAVARVAPEQIARLMHPQIDPKAEKSLLGSGLPASPGAASGVLALDPDDAEARAARGEDVILVRKETSPEDIHGMHAARGILTATGGMTSHAAVVARGMGRPCISGCSALEIDVEAGTAALDHGAGPTVLKVGDPLTLDGTTGQVYAGWVPTVEPELGGDFATFLSWADELRTLEVRANADTPVDAERAVELGAQGIGLCRTEHMFFAPERILAVREMILAASANARERALSRIEPMQRRDFEAIFKAMGGRPVTIRLLDPPLHEFLPQGDDELHEVAEALEVNVVVVRRATEQLREFNPMLGHRGCRLGVTFPEIYEMQARAVLEAACDVASQGTQVQPEVMIPLVMAANELRRLRERVVAVAEEVLSRRGLAGQLSYAVGTMIELPRAALTADQIAAHADFFSFGTNDLTQTTFGLSRDDAGRFLPEYVQAGLLPHNPFASLDIEGVGALVRVGAERGRKVKSELKIGVCGEHGGDPSSVAFFAQLGLDYVSCSPFRVPIARVAAAHAALRAQT